MVEDILSLRPVLVRLEELKEHERYDPEHLEELLQDISSCGVLRRPIIADKKTKVILDGHHRYNSLKRLGCKYIPVYFVDYFRSEIEVHQWDNKPLVTKEDVIKAGTSGKLLPSRSSKHMVRIGNELHHITYIEHENPTKIEDLR
ncbi:MAG: ParB N-terminal domain-containing protein [Aigarchaeota archaeon]|nr:ParB N-terminal domain-containing protein [Aigarchaeota archaeon]MDW8092963.1 ParB N-terminal domain-containing protein [Nitrososphaerota archaeon]